MSNSTNAKDAREAVGSEGGQGERMETVCSARTGKKRCPPASCLPGGVFPKVLNIVL